MIVVYFKSPLPFHPEYNEKVIGKLRNLEKKLPSDIYSVIANSIIYQRKENTCLKLKPKVVLENSGPN